MSFLMCCWWFFLNGIKAFGKIFNKNSQSCLLNNKTFHWDNLTTYTLNLQVQKPRKQAYKFVFSAH